MRRAREADPAFAAQFRSESGPIAQVPTNPVAFYVEISLAFVLRDSIFTRFEKQRTHTPRAEIKFFQRKSLNPRLRPSFAREPRCPHLHGLSRRIISAPAPSGARQQIPKPPRSAAIREA